MARPMVLGITKPQKAFIEAYSNCLNKVTAAKEIGVQVTTMESWFMSEESEGEKQFRYPDFVSAFYKEENEIASKFVHKALASKDPKVLIRVLNSRLFKNSLMSEVKDKLNLEIKKGLDNPNIEWTS